MYDSSLLMIAAATNELDIMRLLIDRGADVNAVNCDGDTALIMAAREGCTDAVRLLLNDGAELYLQNNDGRTALSYAEEAGHTEAAQLLRDSSMGRTDASTNLCARPG